VKDLDSRTDLESVTKSSSSDDDSAGPAESRVADFGTFPKSSLLSKGPGAFERRSRATIE
jgi:hypothetical protein